MAKLEPYEPRGVIPACLLPFHADLRIDEASYRKHLQDAASVRGLSAITVNAHGSEIARLRKALDDAKVAPEGALPHAA